MKYSKIVYIFGNAPTQLGSLPWILSVHFISIFFLGFCRSRNPILYPVLSTFIPHASRASVVLVLIG
jgi:hypothetical protein